MGSGFNFFLNAVDKTPTTTGAWVDVDCSADIPSGATGVILDIHNTASAITYQFDVRKNGSTDDDYANGKVGAYRHVYAVIGVDGNRIFEAAILNTAVKIYLKGYTDENVVLFTNKVNKSTSTTGSYVDTDVSGDVSTDATGVILKIINTSTTTSYNAAVRKNGSTDDRYYYARTYTYSTHIYALIGIDANKIFEQKIADTAMDVYLVGYTKPPVTFFTNGIDKSLTTTGSFQDIDVTADTEASADGAIWEIVNTAAAYYKGEFRKNGSTDNHTASSRVYATTHIWALVGLDTENICEGYIENIGVDFYLIGYCKPAGAILIEVTDGVGLSDVVLTDKTFTIEDSVGLTDAPLTDKTFAIEDSIALTDVALRDWSPQVTDSVALADEVALSKFFEVLDSIGLVDAISTDKSLQVSDSISLSDQVPLTDKTLIAQDSISLTDEVLRDKIFKILDSVGLSDEIALSKFFEILDSVGLTDAVLTDKTFAVTDAISLVDSPLADKTLAIEDAIALAEQILTDKTFAIEDSIALSDAVLRDWSPQVTDAIALTDELLRDKSFSIEDEISLAEAILRDKTLSVEDAISLSEIIEVIGAILKEVLDAIGLTDTTLIDKTLLVSDSVSLTEQALTDKTFQILDSIGLSDQVLRDKILEILDSVVLTDILLSDKTLVISDSISLSEIIEVIGAAVIKEVLDSISLTDTIKAWTLIEPPLLIVTRDGKIILRVSSPTKSKPDYIILE